MLNKIIPRLEEIGFTQTQAKIYLALLKTGKTDAKTLEKIAKTTNQVIYRALNELQVRGLVEKKVTSPLQYEAVPINQAMEIILCEKTNELHNTLEKSKEIIKAVDRQLVFEDLEQDFQISVIETKHSIINKSKLANQKVLKTVDCCSTFQRCIQMGQEISDTIKKAQDRDVKYRVILEKSSDKVCLPQELKKIVQCKNCQVKVAPCKLEINAVVFDGKYASFNYYSPKSFAKSPMVWTNHPAIVTAFEYYFLDKWRHSADFFPNYVAVS